MEYLYSFLLCGGLCLIAQVIYEFTKLTPGHITSIFVLGGVLLHSFGVYEMLLQYAPGGASLPITNFGYLLANSAVSGLKEEGIIGLFKSLLIPASSTLTFVVVFSSIAAVIGKPHP